MCLRGTWLVLLLLALNYKIHVQGVEKQGWQGLVFLMPKYNMGSGSMLGF